MNNDIWFDDAVLARIDEIVDGAVEQGQAPGVVAGVACGDRAHVAQAGMPAVCYDVLAAAREYLSLAGKGKA